MEDVASVTTEGLYREQLPEAYREALTLTELGGLSQRDAAARAGLSLSGMKSRVQRGRAKLTELLLRCCEVELDVRRRAVGFEARSSCGDGGACSPRPVADPGEPTRPIGAGGAQRDCRGAGPVVPR
jgi:hypothetical protein